MTDPLERVTTYGLDAGDRLESLALPGARTVGFGHDRDGLLTSLTPPGRVAHRFGYTATGLNDVYTPPGLPGLVDPATRYTYNADGQLTDVSRPDGGVVHLDYHPTTGQLLSIAPPAPRPPVAFTYLASGQVHTIASPDTVTCTYEWDGPLLKRENWSGAVAGTVERGYDNAFRLSTERVNNAQQVTYGHDADGLVTSEAVSGGTLTLHRGSAGWVDSTGVGAVTSTEVRNTHGELTELSWHVGGSLLFWQKLRRDALGRVTRSDETFSGTSSART